MGISEYSSGMLSGLTAEARRAALALLNEKARREKHRKLYTYFPDEGPFRRELYPKQMMLFKAGAKYPERCFMAANRVGKTESILCELTYHMTGRYPDWWVGKRFNKPVVVWLAGTTAETTRDILQRKLLGPLDELGTGIMPGEFIIGEPRRDSGIPDAVETFSIRHKSGGVSRGQFKAYKQGRKSFEGDEIDIIIQDEEPPLDIYSECVIRTMTTGGIIILGFTPLEGLTETVQEFMKEGMTTDYKGKGIGRKFIIGATWDDVPHLDEKAKEELRKDIPPHLVAARSKGIPMLGSGAIYPIDEDDILVPDFIIPEYWPKVYGMDVGWKATAAVWGAWDRTHDIIYLTSEYKRGQAEPPSHAGAIKARGEWMNGVIDPASRGRSQADGTKLIQKYEDLGLHLYTAVNAVEAGLFEVYKRMTQGRLKVFKSMVGWLEEFRIYRRDKNGHVVKQNDHYMDCTRYLVMSGPQRAKVQPTRASMKNKTVTEIMDMLSIGET